MLYCRCSIGWGIKYKIVRIKIRSIYRDIFTKQSDAYFTDNEIIDLVDMNQCKSCVYGLRQALGRCKGSARYKDFNNGT